MEYLSGEFRFLLLTKSGIYRPVNSTQQHLLFLNIPHGDREEPTLTFPSRTSEKREDKSIGSIIFRKKTQTNR